MAKAQADAYSRIAATLKVDSDGTSNWHIASITGDFGPLGNLVDLDVSRHRATSEGPAKATAVGRPAITSTAKLGPEIAKKAAFGAAFSATAAIRLPVARSIPLAAEMSGTAPIAMSFKTSFMCWAGTAATKMSPSSLPSAKKR